MTPAAIAKVVATGPSRPGWLRATVTLSPTDETDGTLVSTWPTALFEWLCGAKPDAAGDLRAVGPWMLRLWAVPAPDVGCGKETVLSEWIAQHRADPEHRAKYAIDATASAARAAWQGHPAAGWLGDLWCRAFDVQIHDQDKLEADAIRSAGRIAAQAVELMKAGKEVAPAEKRPDKDDCAPFLTVPPKIVWCTLAKALLESNAGSKIGGKPTAAAPEPAASTPASAVAGASAAPKVTVDAVLPTLQSDLATVLELQRAWELCATARLASGEIDACIAEETRCADLLRCAVRTPSIAPVDDLHQPASLQDQSDKQRKAATEAVKASYDACKPIAVQAEDAIIGVDPEQAAKGTREDAIASGEYPVDSQAHATATPPLSIGQCPATVDVGQIASQRFFAIQGTPGLSRLYGLTIDVEFPARQLEEALGGSDGFGWLGVEFPQTVTAREPVSEVWTAFKVRGGSHFWPVTREEMQVPKDQAWSLANLSQFDGVLVAGRPLALKPALGDDDPSSAPAVTVPRLSLTSLNVHTAAEGVIDRRDACDSRTGPASASSPIDKNAAPPLPPRPINPGSMPAEWARKTYQTAGLVLLDRGRQLQAVRQLAARDVHSKRKGAGGSNSIARLFLDAEDLTIGYRIDVAVPLRKTSTPAWRTLMARQIAHGTSGDHGGDVARVLPLLMSPLAERRPGDDGTEWQRTLEDAMLALPVRLVDMPQPKPMTDGPSPESATSVVAAYVEESIAIWTGEPMGAHCAGPREKKVTSMELGVGDTIGVPTGKQHPERRPPPLRFGYPYRFGIRVVYAGAISVPLTQAIKTYERPEPKALQCLMTVPGQHPDTPVSRRRFLRHERIDAPYMLMPEHEAMRKNKAMASEIGSHVILRSADEPCNADRNAPNQSRRVFVAPNVDIHFAAMHGVFDKVGDSTLPQGLVGIDFSAANGGFPYVSSKRQDGINGEIFERDRHVSKAETEHGDLVFQHDSHRSPEDRPHAYYPDPFAMSFAIGIRHAGTERYLDGPPALLPLYAHGTAHPHARPLFLHIERTGPRQTRAALPWLRDVLEIPTGPSRCEHDAVEAILKLAPGDDFEVDVWCIPDRAGLARTSALVEAIGVMALTRTQHCTMAEALRDLLPAQVCVKVEAHCARTAGFSLSGAVEGREGLGGLAAPSAQALEAIAVALHETLSSRPLSEIAATTTLRATHAIDHPRRVPAFHVAVPRPSWPIIRHPPVFPAAPIRANRLAASAASSAVAAPAASAGAAAASPIVAATQANAAAVPASAASAPSNGTPATDGTASHSPNALPHEYALAGEMLIDIATTGAFEVRAVTSFPTVVAFDDSYRGRSTKDKREGRWPAMPSEGASGPNTHPKRLCTRDVFGFDVDTLGCVSLPTSEVTLLRVEQLPTPLAVADRVSDDGLLRLPLDVFAAPDPTTAFGTVKARHVFPDKKARRLDLYVLADPRHALLMRTANAIDGGWERPGKPLGSTPRGKDDPLATVWLDAAVRPSEPVCGTPVPAFVWTSGPPGANIHRQSRRSIVRIPLARGWYSSGDGEQLGVVVWPPQLFSAPEWRLANDEVMTRDGRSMTLDQFSDEDLGPGGRFITRWGDDPIRPAHDAANALKHRTFIPPSAFRDVLVAGEGGFEAEVVESVRMPVRLGKPAKTAPGDPGAKPDTFMDVSLVTYVPRFDIETEQWYVDLAIDHPLEAEPFLRLGLVRYQPHAPEELQLSYPVVQWTQLLPERSVEVSVTATATPKTHSRTVAITVQGVRTVSPLTAKTSTQDDPNPEFWEQVMTACIVREYVSDAGLSCRTLLQPMTPMQTQQGAPGQDAWQHAGIDFSVDPLLDKTQQAKYSVYIEEFERRLPATYPAEPVSPEIFGQPAFSISSGPRFAARVDL